MGCQNPLAKKTALISLIALKGGNESCSLLPVTCGAVAARPAASLAVLQLCGTGTGAAALGLILPPSMSSGPCLPPAPLCCTHSVFLCALLLWFLSSLRSSTDPFSFSPAALFALQLSCGSLSSWRLSGLGCLLCPCNRGTGTSTSYPRLIPSPSCPPHHAAAVCASHPAHTAGGVQQLRPEGISALPERDAGR